MKCLITKEQFAVVTGFFLIPYFRAVLGFI